MTVFGVKTRVETPKGLIGPTFVGKRINLAGDIGTVAQQSDKLCLIKFDNYNTVGVVFQSVIAKFPILYSRKEFYPYV